MFPCGGEALDALKRRDKRLGRVIERLGPIRRRGGAGSVYGSRRQRDCTADFRKGRADDFRPAARFGGELYAARPCRRLPPHRSSSVASVSVKLDIYRGSPVKSPPVLWIWRPWRHAPDEELIRKLSALNGIGVWTAEMLMIFSLCRPDVLSWGDLGIRRGMALLYGDRELTRERFERRRKRYSPYGSVVSLYLWSIAGMEEALAVKLPRG